MDNALLNFHVQRAISGKTGHLVDFDEIGAQLVVNHNVKTQNLKAYTVFVVVRLTRTEQVQNVRLRQTHRFHYDVINPLPNLFHLFNPKVFFDFLEHPQVGSLTSHPILVNF